MLREIGQNLEANGAMKRLILNKKTTKIDEISVWKYSLVKYKDIFLHGVYGVADIQPA